jgi:hypothetical protein
LKDEQTIKIGNIPAIITFIIYLITFVYPLNNSFFAVAALYLGWWILISYRFNLWRRKEAVLWGILMLIILLQYKFSISPFMDSQILGSSFLALAIYASLFYSWSYYSVYKEAPVIRLDILVLFTVSVFIFMYYHNSVPYIPYIEPVLLIIWWAAITSKFNKWKSVSGIIWGIITLFISFKYIPFFVMLMMVLISFTTMLGILFLFLLCYTGIYYIICTKKSKVAD